MAPKSQAVTTSPTLLQTFTQVGTLVMISLGVFMVAVDLGRKDETLRRIALDTGELRGICAELVKAQIKSVENDTSMQKELAILTAKLDRITLK
jgi:hypothetical protein